MVQQVLAHNLNTMVNLLVNKFDKGDRIYYLLMDSICKSSVKDFYLKDGKYLYIDNIFNDIKEEYIFTTRKECLEFHKKKHIIK